jgi:hypothetical protein
VLIVYQCGGLVKSVQLSPLQRSLFVATITFVSIFGNLSTAVFITVATQDCHLILGVGSYHLLPQPTFKSLAPGFHPLVNH